jgi:hypothetical protein
MAAGALDDKAEISGTAQRDTAAGTQQNGE